MKRDTRRFLSAVIIVLVLLLLLGGVGAYRMKRRPGSTAAPQSVIRVQAYIDGLSRLRIRGNTAQWDHYLFTAPGLHSRTPRPTIINGKEWFPVWIGASIYGGSDSSAVWQGVDPPLPAMPLLVSGKKIQARGEATIVEQPSADNRYTLVIEFDDNSGPGAEDYIVELSFPTSPAASGMP
jgi:hypothetical protein